MESLYFKYPKFRFRRAPELTGASDRYPVVVAGAGPVGMTAALSLARQGIRSVVLDEKDTLNDGSRAICVSRHSFETLQQLGAVEPFEHKSLGWTNGRSYYRDRIIYRLEMPHSDQERFFPMYNIQQQYIERFLADRIGEVPDLIDIRWQSRVSGVGKSADEVTLCVTTPEGEYPLRARYLLAADGARSRIRDALGLRLKGENLPGHYVIADIQMDHDFPTERRCFFESVANPESTILIHRQPDNIWRIDWQLGGHEDAAQAIGEERIRARVQSILDMIGHTGAWELEWWSIYTANSLCLDAYRHGPVLFAGDAAHIVPIFGVRGLNNGLDDAVNAAWKLAYVLNGEAEETLLDSYTPERRGATLDVFRNAGRSSRFMTPPSRGYSLMRKAALQLSLTREFTRRFADPRQVAPYTYRGSPLTSCVMRDSEFCGGVEAGDVAVNRKIAEGDYLLDHLGCGFTGLYFTQKDQLPDRILALFVRLAEIDRKFKPLLLASRGLQRRTFEVIEDRQRNIFTAYAAADDSFYLLRPDRHVAARWVSVEPDEVEQALLTALGRNRR
ncbi:MAG: FAD-dependent monooxygenase [Woeseia sp.]